MPFRRCAGGRIHAGDPCISGMAIGDSLQTMQLMGSNGMHRDSNQDHSMTAICAARNIPEARNLCDPNAAADCLEEAGVPFAPDEPAVLETTQPPVPGRVRAAGCGA
jgi:hypothetical protein